MKTKRIKPVFKMWDKVYYISYGWGTVVEVREDDDYGVDVHFDDLDSESFTLDGRLFVDSLPVLSFTEYTLSGLSQERPEELPNKGDIVWVRSNSESRWVIGHFVEKDDSRYFISCNNKDKQFFGSQLSTTNPYKQQSDE